MPFRGAPFFQKPTQSSVAVAWFFASHRRNADALAKNLTSASNEAPVTRAVSAEEVGDLEFGLRSSERADGARGGEPLDERVGPRAARGLLRIPVDLEHA